MIMNNILKKLIIMQLIIVLLSSCAYAARIKDISKIKGMRRNQLVGYGLVVGLNGTGDGKDAEFTIQSMSSMLDKLGVTVRPDDIDVDNVAAVIVTANLPPFSKAGSSIDVTVSSIGDAENLQGGNLLFTPLKAADGKIYAVAQGAVSTGGFSAGGAGGKVQKNFPTVGRIVNGAIIEREIYSNFSQKKTISLILNYPDFTTASRVTEAINTAFLYDHPAVTSDPGSIVVKIPEKFAENIVEFVTIIERMEIIPDTVARIVINERTGTLVMGNNVRISTIAIAHGNLSIQIKESEDVAQPLPFSKGETVVSPDTNISVEEENRKLLLLKSGVSIGELVRALNALGVTPRDLIAIFQSIKAAGALQASLEII